MEKYIRYAFAGDREIAVQVLAFLIDQGTRPVALLVDRRDETSTADDLIGLCPFLERDHILSGKEFGSDEGKAILASLDLDYIFAIHFYPIVPGGVLDIPHEGVLNLHPAYLPFNKGWHTPSWAILDGTPYGATLHFMSRKLDSGDIVHRRLIEVRPDDTAHTLYGRALKAELDAFKEAWPLLRDRSYTRTAQDPEDGTSHRQRDLEAMQCLDDLGPMAPGDLIDRLRALTTNDPGEAAFITVDGVRYRVQVNIQREG